MGEPALREYICTFEFGNYEKDKDLIPRNSEFPENKIKQGPTYNGGGYCGWIVFRAGCCFA
jgi:hypothetical protein